MSKTKIDVDAMRKALEKARPVDPSEEEEMSPPSFEEICLAWPLYMSKKIDDSKFLATLKSQNLQFDAFCTDCEKPSTFKTQRSTGGGQPVNRRWMYEPSFIYLELACQRQVSHRYIFHFYFDGQNLVKYGQIPSLEDVAGADIRQYEKLLPDGYFGELKRATGLASHGIGIGSFVYLRRIFERLVQDHRVEFEDAHGEIDRFDTLRMAEKVKALKTVLPPALVKNASAYGILSKGIHELDEETCRKYFPVVRQAIISILEQDLMKRRQAEEAEKLNKQIASISGELAEFDDTKDSE